LSAVYFDYLENSTHGYRDLSYQQLPLLYFPGKSIVMEHFINVEPWGKTFHNYCASTTLSIIENILVFVTTVQAPHFITVMDFSAYA
jgi:hypothetical protein